MKPGRKKSDNLTDEFKNVVASASTEELKTKVVNLSKYEMDTLKAKNEDVALGDALALAKELAAPYRDTLKGLRAQRNHVLRTLEERGK